MACTEISPPLRRLHTLKPKDASVRIGFVTIGQSPRDDLINVFRNRMGEGNDLLLAGALDGISADGVADLAPTNDEEPLVTQLQTGQSVTIA